MRRLSRQTTPDGALIGASAGDAAGIVHLGLGNFHRAHAAVYTAHALAAEPGEWGLHGFANRSRDVVTAMSAQDGRYSILDLSDHGRSAGVVDVHRGLGVLAEILTRIYFDGRHRRIYTVDRVVADPYRTTVDRLVSGGTGPTARPS